MSAARYTIVALALTALYVGCAQVGLVLRLLHADVTPLWPPSGLGLALVWLGGRRWLPVILVGEMLTALSLDQPWLAGLNGAVAQGLEAVFALLLIQRLQLSPTLDSSRSIILFLGVVALGAPTLSAGLGMISLYALDLVPLQDAPAAWLFWWLGDALGIAILTPAIVLWWLRPWPRWSMIHDWLLATAVVLAFLLVTDSQFPNQGWTFFFLLMPYVGYCAYRQGTTGAVAAILLLTGLVLSQEVIGVSNQFAATLKMAFIGTSAFMGLLLGTAVERHRLSRQRLSHTRHHLEAILDSMSDGLVVVNARGDVERINPVAQRILGVDESEALEHKFDRLCAVEPADGMPWRTPLEDFRHQSMPEWQQVCRRLRAGEGEQYLDLRIRAMPVSAGQQGAVIVLRDVTADYQLKAQLAYQAQHDELTGLPNRRALNRQLQQRLAYRCAGQTGALLYIDLDQFKLVNDTCGHEVGDQMLQDISQCLNEQVPENAFLARISGDEFALALEANDEEEVLRAAEKLRQALLHYRFRHDHLEFSVGASIGVTFFSTRDEQASAVLSRADIACYQAKEAGRNRIRTYHPQDINMLRYQSELEWISQLKYALSNDRFVLFAQGIHEIDADARLLSTVSREVLIRLRQDGNYVSPGTFMPIAERFGYMPVIDRWVTETVIKQLVEAGSEDSVYNINLSAATFNDMHFFEDVAAWCEQYRVSPQSLCFEITESVALSDLDYTRQLLTELNRQGYRFALDDFGSGSASYAYLRELPVAVVKLDGHFVRSLSQDPASRIVIESLVRIAQLGNIRCVAECVEDADVARQLHTLGVNWMQGFHYDRPAPLSGKA
ncbi:EAL domain-containing protein [Marinobacteraceae bacterium S3BR75-40.1]